MSSLRVASLWLRSSKDNEFVPGERIAVALALGLARLGAVGAVDLSWIGLPLRRCSYPSSANSLPPPHS